MSGRAGNSGIKSLNSVVSDVKLLADAIKQATEDAETETISSFTSNDSLTNLQSTLSDAVTAAQGAIESATKTLADGAKVTTTISGGAHSVTREV